MKLFLKIKVKDIIMIYLLFDFETTGINFENKTIPQRAIQLAWIIVNTDLPKQKIVKSENFMISGQTEINTDFHTDLTVEQLNTHGLAAKIVIEKFHTDVTYVIQNGGVLVAHNIDFDYRIYKNEMLIETGKMIELVAKQRFCTMRNTIEYCKLPSKYQARYDLRNTKKQKANYKFPKLIELYVTLFNRKPTVKLHDAMNDVMVTMQCFEELRKRNIITDNKIWY